MSEPFPSRTFRAPAGALRFTDAGSGPPVVLLHGNPTSARLYRTLLSDLVPDYRCIAPDHLGFGRSDAPRGGSYRPTAHATRLEALLLRHAPANGLTLVLHDWGGPIGLSFALRHPNRVRRLVLLNTWAWPLAHRPLVRLFVRLLETSLGQRAVEHGNAFARVVMPLTQGRPSVCLPDWVQEYEEALDTPSRRHACWTLARSLIRETAWLRALWTRRHRLRHCTTLLCWGMADPAFGTAATLRRWTTLFPKATVRRWPSVGHYVPEEAGPSLSVHVRTFFQSTDPQ